jgi:hypothetical protein
VWLHHHGDGLPLPIKPRIKHIVGLDEKTIPDCSSSVAV